MNKHEKMNYVEFPAKDIEATKKFFTSTFGWSFTDYGSEYTSFTNEGLNGGFYKSDLFSSAENGSTLIVFFSKHLEETKKKVKNSGGKIIQDVFSFPGGKRFHFVDPNGNEFAVWAE